MWIQSLHASSIIHARIEPSSEPSKQLRCRVQLPISRANTSHSLMPLNRVSRTARGEQFARPRPSLQNLQLPTGWWGRSAVLDNQETKQHQQGPLSCVIVVVAVAML